MKYFNTFLCISQKTEKLIKAAKFYLHLLMWSITVTFEVFKK